MVFARRVIELMLLRRGPQDMPGDQTSLAASAAVYCILLVLQVGLITPPGYAVFQAVVATALIAIYVRTVLRMRGLGNRFAQTATSLYAAGATLTLIMLAPTHAMTPYLEAIAQASDPQQVPMPPGYVVLAYVAMGVWGLAIYSHIYRHALDSSIWLGVGAALAFEVLLLVVFSVLG
ncbi:hypothetical protein SAHL_00665 [Salinisphaera orenii YIM 95161]|uniref:Yip1 domain-containing protein n=2 Tax=Salinisphaera TaxID=180541 RepID=A0A423QBJ0_9GAMM|nr:hypothetical protein SAHL_00665 [Salinisphaera halophila YIM 95161]